MSERKVSEMSYEELKLYEKQLTEKLTEVKFYLKNAKRLKVCANSGNHGNAEK